MGEITLPIWPIAAIAFIGALTWLILTHGRTPFAEGKKPFDRLMETVGKPYVIVVILAAAALMIAAYIYYLNDIVVSVHHMVKDLRSEAQAKTINSETLRNLAQGSALLLGALVAASTLVFTLIRVWINERTTTATEEGLITDRINAAVASLSAEKTKKDFDTEKEHTAPNIEVRMGAILALERIAKNNADVHIQIMEILTVYVRENAKLPSDGEPHDHPPRIDIQLALTVIGRRPAKRIALERAEGFKLNLFGCDLTLADLAHLNFEYAQLSYSRLSKANLLHTQFNNATLYGVGFYETQIVNAQFNSADLLDSYFINTSLNGEIAFTSASLHRACIKNADLKGLDLTQGQVNSMFGDVSVTLPDNITRPAHWPTKDLDLVEFDNHWRVFLKTVPPDAARD